MKFVLVVLCTVMLVVSSQIITLEDLLRANGKSYNIATNEIGNGGPPVKIANKVFLIPMSPQSCTTDSCNFMCKYMGYRYGSCVSSDSCRCYN